MQTIQAVDRAFKLLEIVARDPENNFTLRAIADEAGLKASTASRLLATLVGLGYVEQKEYKGAYCLGPMAYALTARGPYRRDLVDAAEARMKELSEELNVHCTLVAMCNGQRYSLCEVAANHPVNLHQAIHVSDTPNDAYAYPTGRVLLAHYNEKKLLGWVERNGLPGDEWPEVVSHDDLHKGLKKIHAEGISIKRDPKGFASLAAPIYEGDNCTAALGVFLVDAACTRKRCREITAALREKTKAIAADLSLNQQR